MPRPQNYDISLIPASKIINERRHHAVHAHRLQNYDISLIPASKTINERRDHAVHATAAHNDPEHRASMDYTPKKKYIQVRKQEIPKLTERTEANIVAIQETNYRIYEWIIYSKYIEHDSE